MGLLKSIGALMGFYAYSIALYLLFVIAGYGGIVGAMISTTISTIVSLYVLLRYVYQIKNVSIKKSIASYAILMAGLLAFATSGAATALGIYSIYLIILNMALFFVVLKINGIPVLTKSEKETVNKTTVAYFLGAACILAFLTLSILLSSGSTTSPRCIAFAGYFCSFQAFNDISGIITLQIGQATGTDWTAVNALFVPSQFESQFESIVASPSAIDNGGTGYFGKAYSYNVYSIGSIPNGTQITVYLNDWKGTETATGTPVAGYIWVSYTTNASNTVQYVRLAAFATNATVI